MISFVTHEIDDAEVGNKTTSVAKHLGIGRKILGQYMARRLFGM
jgi:hypothetical protein